MSLNTTIRVELEGEIADKFLELKVYLGLKNNAEVVRNCISMCYASMFPADKVQQGTASRRSQKGKGGVKNG